MTTHAPSICVDCRVVDTKGCVNTAVDANGNNDLGNKGIVTDTTQIMLVMTSAQYANLCSCAKMPTSATAFHQEGFLPLRHR